MNRYLPHWRAGSMSSVKSRYVTRLSDIDDLIAARDRAGKVLQVGYMKRYDPSYEAALARMPGTAKTLRYVAVEVNDPDAWPFIKHHTWRHGDDVVPDLISSVKAKQQATGGACRSDAS